MCLSFQGVANRCSFYDVKTILLQKRMVQTMNAMEYSIVDPILKGKYSSINNGNEKLGDTKLNYLKE